jgi:hypothetical protein
MRSLRILTTQFPAFGALFDTLAIAKNDLINFSVSMFLLALGFAFACCLLFGTEEIQMNNFFKTYERLFYFAFGDGDANIVKGPNAEYFTIFYITYSIIFLFILTKTLVSIVTVRYRYLRSLKQLNNEANARIVGKKYARTKKIITNLI